ncbi:MAG: DUF3048 domain-containing protein, partial [Lachnospiraceae bacterium]|nr:DUF3048 domain-containing protein [Lachnospiraceae bacterium]
MKKHQVLAVVAAMTMMLTGCGNVEVEVAQESAPAEIWETIEAAEETIEVAVEETVVEEENHDGMYRSELTGEWIDLSLQNQRPIAVMVDNELTALQHYGLTEADIVYELMNSTANGRVTRLMPIVKDWAALEQFGSIRSARPTNFMLAAEYNAILCHDGGPFYINDYVAKAYTNNISGGFARFSNGKSAEFTEYITYEDYTNPTTGKSYPGLATQISNYNYKTEYTDLYEGAHFIFRTEEFDLSDQSNVQAVKDVILPHPHNSSELHYNSGTATYDYYEYGDPHLDALHDNAQLTFKNVILQSTDYEVYDENGYMIYDVVSSGEGYYLTNGNCIPITWSK